MKNLRAICDAATQGPYHVTHLNENEPRFDVENNEGIRFADEMQQCDFDYIATFCPNQVRKLLDVIELQREALEFYGHKAIVTVSDPPVSCSYWTDQGISDYGKRAREALAKSEELLK